MSYEGTQHICASCGVRFTRHYRMNATRAAKPQYCSRICVGVANEGRWMTRLGDRLMSRVQKGAPEECWPWVGRRDPNGYGRFDCEGRPQLAHRMVFMACNGPLDADLCVRHKCDNPPCCNPNHLEAGTHQDNMQDMVDRGRSSKVPTKFGADVHTSKLSAEQAIAIYKSALSDRVLAQEYGISTTAVRYIKQGRNWSSITGARDAQRV